jgi:outer membrane immunogenic protein
VEKYPKKSGKVIDTLCRNLDKGAVMKRFLTLTGILTSVIGLTLSVAGPERYHPKSVVEPIAQPECNWTGFYLGIHAGYADGSVDWIDSDTPEESSDSRTAPFASQKQTGIIGGLQGGYNYQWHSLVVGAEGEFSYGDITARDSLAQPESDILDYFKVRTNWEGTIAGRVGFAWRKWLLYGKGGGAFAHTDFTLDHNGDKFRADETRFAPMVGVGLEYMINCNWSAKLEFQHDFFGKEAIDGTNVELIDSTGGGGPEKETYDIDMTHNTVRFGLNYKF